VATAKEQKEKRNLFSIFGKEKKKPFDHHRFYPFAKKFFDPPFSLSTSLFPPQKTTKTGVRAAQQDPEAQGQRLPPGRAAQDGDQGLLDEEEVEEERKREEEEGKNANFLFCFFEFFLGE